MTDLEMYTSILELLNKNREIALATIVSKVGASPARLSSKMIIIKEGLATIGTVGGGCLEAEIITKSKNVFKTGKPEVIKYHLDDEDPESWLICGGTVEILIEPVLQKNYELFNSAVNVIREDSRGILCTIIHENSSEKYALCGSRWIGKQPERSIADKITEMYDSVIDYEKPMTIEPSVFLDPLIPPVKLFIFGGGHISLYLSRFSKMTGFNTTIIDDRIKFANKERFSFVDNVVCDDFEKVFEKLSVDKNSYLVIVTRGHKHDKIVLEKALGTDACYIGMIGSKKKVVVTFRKLNEAGFDKKSLKKVFSPIGLNIGAKTPEEIAISIISEIIKLRRKRNDSKVDHMKSSIDTQVDKVLHN